MTIKMGIKMRANIKEKINNIIKVLVVNLNGKLRWYIKGKY